MHAPCSGPRRRCLVDPDRLPSLGHSSDVPTRAGRMRSRRVHAREHPPTAPGPGLPEAVRWSARSRAVGSTGERARRPQPRPGGRAADGHSTQDGSRTQPHTGVDAQSRQNGRRWPGARDLEARIPHRHHLPAGPVDAPRRCGPRTRPAVGAHCRPRRSHRGRRGGGMGASPWPAVRARTHRSGGYDLRDDPDAPGAEHVSLDAVEFCRTLAGRDQAIGLLATVVPF